jgi:hypothetical protein
MLYLGSRGMLSWWLNFEPNLLLCQVRVGDCLGADGPGLTTRAVARLGVGSPGMVKITKRASDYEPATEPGRNCDTCKYMHDDGSCDLVVGIVKPNMVCRLWAK